MNTLLKSAAVAIFLSVGLIATASAALIGRLPTTVGDTDYQAYYDDVLDITWAADANINNVMNTWVNQNAWAAGLTIGGVIGWRLPSVTPINGSTYNTALSNNATTDQGYADSTGWVDGLGNPVSEMGHLYYVTLGNLGFCTPDNSTPSNCTQQAGFGLTNIGPFSNVQTSYWSSSEFGSTSAWLLDTRHGHQIFGSKASNSFAWAVHSGDVSAVPVPGAIWLLGSGLIGLVGLLKRNC